MNTDSVRTIIVNKQEVEVPKQAFLCLVPDPGLRVDVPDAFEINGRTTLKWCEEVTDKDWQHISTGPLFQHLFSIVFPQGCRGHVAIPATTNELREIGFDVQHIVGLICLSVEYGWGNPAKGTKPQNIYFREPETHLHPQQTLALMSLISALFPHWQGPMEQKP